MVAASGIAFADGIEPEDAAGAASGAAAFSIAFCFWSAPEAFKSLVAKRPHETSEDPISRGLEEAEQVSEARSIEMPLMETDEDSWSEWGISWREYRRQMK